MPVYLEREQVDLFQELLAARDSRPREQREAFMVIRTFGGDSVQGNGLVKSVQYEDLVALRDADLISVTQHHSKGTGFNFSIAPGSSDKLKAVQIEGEEAPPVDPAPLPEQVTEPTGDTRAVMVVHGRDMAARDAMFEFLRGIGLRPLEWDELVAETGKGAPYVGEILEAAFKKAQAVVVLFTPDDEAQLREAFRGGNEDDWESTLTPQARPNVLFEAGMALGVHPDQTVLVELGRLRPFSDIYGRHAVRLKGREGLRDIANRLERAGCEVDRSKDDWDSFEKFPTTDESGGSPKAPTDQAEARVADLNEDMRRWIADRDRVLSEDSKRVTNEMASKNLLYSGAHLNAQAEVKRAALHEYRDEVSSKRREFREIVENLNPGDPSLHFTLKDEARDTLNRWREPATIEGAQPKDIDDPTSEEREPDLRRFEAEGDRP